MGRGVLLADHGVGAVGQAAVGDFELDAELTVTMHIQTVDQVKAIKTVKGKISDIDKMKVEEQRKATRAGYDP